MNKVILKVLRHTVTLALLLTAYFLYGANSAGVGGPIVASLCLVAGVILEFTAWYRWSPRGKTSATPQS